MDETAGYIVWTVLFIIILVLIRVFCTVICRNVSSSSTTNHPRTRRRVVRRIEITPGQTTVTDRQGNIFTISDESGGARTYPDFFVLEPSSDDPRLRSQIEKDDKDLPTYEEVMGLSNITSPTAAPAISSDLPMDVPPYTETDPNPLPTTSANTFTIAIPANVSTATTTTTTATSPQTPQPSTSRGLSVTAATAITAPAPAAVSSNV